MLARGATLAALKDKGLRLDLQGEHIAVPVQASANAADLGVQDLVIVAVKAPAMADVARRIGPLIGPNTVVLTAMNGVPWWFLQGFGGALSGTTLQSVDPSGVIAQHIPADRVIGGVVHSSCSVDMPGVIRHHFGNGLHRDVGRLTAHDTCGFEAIRAIGYRLACGVFAVPAQAEIANGLGGVN